MSLKILGVTLIKNGEKLKVKLSNHEGVNSKDGRECQDPVNSDMVTAMNALAPHFAIHTDYLSEKNASDRKALECLIITSYSWNKEETGVTLTGVRTTKRGRPLVMNVMIPVEGDLFDQYILLPQFLKDIKAVEFEVNEYLSGRKKKLSGAADPAKDGKGKTVTNMKVAPPDPSGMTGEGKEFTAGEYKEEVNKTTKLREAGKVVPIKKPGKKTEKPEDKEYTPETLEAHLASRKRNPGGKPRAEKQAVRKNHLGQELSNSAIPVSEADRKKAKGK